MSQHVSFYTQIKSNPIDFKSNIEIAVGISVGISVAYLKQYASLAALNWTEALQTHAPRFTIFYQFLVISTATVKNILKCNSNNIEFGFMLRISQCIISCAWFTCIQNIHLRSNRCDGQRLENSYEKRMLLCWFNWINSFVPKTGSVDSHWFQGFASMASDSAFICLR